MKKLIAGFALLIVGVSPLYGEKPRISMRSSESPGSIRFVFEGADPEFLRGAQASQSYSLLKIEFPGEFDFTFTKKPERVDVSKKTKSLFVTISGLKGIKIFNLTDPPRLVIDAELEKTGAEAERLGGEGAGEAPQLSGPTVVIDPGHGGYDIGLVGNDYKEKDMVFSLAQSFRYVANQSGYNVYLTRTSDRYVTIAERIWEAYARKPAMFISLHISTTPEFVIYFAKMDALSDAAAQYELQYQQFKYMKKSDEFARAIGESLKQRFKRNVKIRQMPLPLLSAIGAPALLIELPDKKDFGYSDADRSAIINALLRGIIAYEKR